MRGLEAGGRGRSGSSDGALKLAANEQRRTGAQIAGLLMDQCCLGSSQTVDAESAGIQGEYPNPEIDEARVLSCPHRPNG